METNQKRKSINFDLDTNKLKEIYATEEKKFNQAYFEIKKFMKENGFSHRQGSGYISNNPMSDTDVINFIIKLQNRFPWIYDCSKKIDGTEINTQFDLRSFMESKDIGLKKTTNKSEIKKEDMNNSSSLKKTEHEQETVTISKKEYDFLLNSSKATAKKTDLIAVTNLVFKEHPELAKAFIAAKAETLQRQAEQEKTKGEQEKTKGGLNDKSDKNKTFEKKKNKLKL